jgi:hypothetical protein
MQVNNDQDDRIPGNNMLSSDINGLYTDPQNSSVNINPEKKNSGQKRKIYPTSKKKHTTLPNLSKHNEKVKLELLPIVTV